MGHTNLSDKLIKRRVVYGVWIQPPGTLDPHLGRKWVYDVGRQGFCQLQKQDDGELRPRQRCYLLLSLMPVK